MRIPGIAAGTLIVPVQAHSHAHGDTMYTYTYLLTRRGSSRTGPVQCPVCLHGIPGMRMGVCRTGRVPPRE